MSTHSPHGQHAILDLYGVIADDLMDAVIIEAALLNAAQILNATVLQCHMHTFGEGMGVTGVLLLAESHMSIHTWPEAGYCAIDIFMCGRIQLNDAIEALLHAFAPTHHQLHILQRGHSG
ncbi:adenosylmethionine decarboxylase [Wohlfahrtiimonas chitiniclastica]|uniref:adenosylmethionine decarboxylase n=1 Tax=Wohlfahrtiimonas chitiniclastica TaxID=400946 RepID=UPI000B98C364|nr:adenosylmethionine decarboxylase [Wohlfahrtiimonas chitiniclastica]OYQ85844.1 adenosylmethionine decarboxylase [Wohlfahrtiimonas chitiniclastica]OYQ85918.1 adenosylmethionine decarboxylase [Wohlfahrtiimonas chitiniclastica]